jgi:hypothetical protein
MTRGESEAVEWLPVARHARKKEGEEHGSLETGVHRGAIRRDVIGRAIAVRGG